MPTVREFLEKIKFDGPVSYGEPMSGRTTFRIGGPADLLVRAHTPDALARAVLAARAAEVPHFILGRGANILVGDGGFRGVVIRSEARPGEAGRRALW